MVGFSLGSTRQKENAENSPACLYLDLEVHRLFAFFFICKNLLFVLYMLSGGFSHGGKDGESMSTPSFLEADVIAGPFFFLSSFYKYRHMFREVVYSKSHSS